MQDLLLQLSFQLVRTKDTTLLAEKLREFLRRASANVEVNEPLLTIAFKMIAQVRDITDGKGECDLGYMQILVWNEIYPELAHFALEQFVSAEGHPYGSWKDIKRFCAYAVAENMPINSPIIVHALGLIGKQIREDTSAERPSLAAKWVPRESSKSCGWMFKIIAESYYPEIMKTAADQATRFKASRKCKTMFRQVISGLNRALDTVQIKQCANTWALIDHSKVTSVTISKQKNALLNKKNDGSRRSEREDRIVCAESFQARIAAAVKGEVVMKGKRVGMDTFAAEAIKLINAGKSDKDAIDIVNTQWEDSSKLTGPLDQMVALVDVSGSMSPDAILPALALGIRVAGKSALGDRVMTFSETPMWHNLEGCDGFVDKVASLSRAHWGQSTKFSLCFQLILESAMKMKIAPEVMSGMVFAVFSDMQMDIADHSYNDTAHENVEKMYRAAGYEPPHMLYWNLRSTSGTPCLSGTKNVSMLSGFSPTFLNLFCERGIEGLKGITPWTMFIESLAKPRYQCMEDKAEVFFLKR